MAGDTMRFRNPAGHAGLLHNLFALLNSLAGFVESRLGLVAQESKTALVHLLVLVGCIVAAGILGLFGYVFLIASAILFLVDSCWRPFRSGGDLRIDRATPDEEINI